MPLHVETYDGALGKVLKNDVMNLIQGNHVPLAVGQHQGRGVWPDPERAGAP